MVSNAHVYYTLQQSPGILVSTGMSRYIRHPNYLGEIMLYSALCLLTQRWESWLVLGAVVFFVLLPEMIKKEKSLSRFPAWTSYYEQSGFLFPYIPAIFQGEIAGEPGKRDSKKSEKTQDDAHKNETNLVEESSQNLQQTKVKQG